MAASQLPSATKRSVPFLTTKSCTALQHGPEPSVLLSCTLTGTARGSGGSSSLRPFPLTMIRARPGPPARSEMLESPLGIPDRTWYLKPLAVACQHADLREQSASAGAAARSRGTDESPKKHSA